MNIEKYCKTFPMGVKLSEDYQRMLALVADHQGHRAANTAKALKGTANINNANMAFVSPEDSLEFMSLFRKYRLRTVRMKRRPRGPNRPKRSSSPNDLRVGDPSVTHYSIYIDLLDPVTGRVIWEKS